MNTINKKSLEISESLDEDSLLTDSNYTAYNSNNTTQPKPSLLRVYANRFSAFLMAIPFPPGFNKFPSMKLIMIIALLHRIHYYSSFYFIYNLSELRSKDSDSKIDIGENTITTATIYNTLPFFLSPIAGYLADKYTRHQIISISLLICFTGSCIQSFFHTLYELQGGIQGLYIVPGVYYTIHSIALSLLVIGSTGIFGLLLPYGVAQMEGAGEREMRAYFNWYYFAVNIGSLLTFGRYIVFPKTTIPGNEDGDPDDNDSLRYIILISTYFSTIASFLAVVIIKLSLAYNLLEKVNASGSPIIKIYRVTKCAFKTWWVKRKEGEVAKQRLLNYAIFENGGRYEYEIVQDVKTFYRLVLVLSCMTWYFSIYSMLTSVYPLQGQEIACTSDTYYSNLLIAFFDAFTIILVIPIFQFIKHRWQYFTFPKILYKFIVGVILGLLSLFVAVTIDGALHARQNCIGEKSPILTFSPKLFLLMPQTILLALSEIFAIICAFEFVYAQSPNDMKGFIFGILNFFNGIGNYIPVALFQILYFVSSCHNSCANCIVHIPKCLGIAPNYAYFIIYIILTIFYLIFFAVVAKIYKRRKRQRVEKWYAQ